MAPYRQEVETRLIVTTQTQHAPLIILNVGYHTTSLFKPLMGHATAPTATMCSLEEV